MTWQQRGLSVTKSFPQNEIIPQGFTITKLGPADEYDGAQKHKLSFHAIKFKRCQKSHNIKKWCKTRNAFLANFISPVAHEKKISFNPPFST